LADDCQLHSRGYLGRDYRLGSPVMHEAFRRRIAALEEARKLRDDVLPTVSIGFTNPDKSEVPFNVAWAGDFKCFRHSDENEHDFELRAHREARLADPRIPPPILIFSDKDISHAAS
jgi:hypothetical protein